MSVTFASRSFSTGFYGGSALNTEVPAVYPTALDGVPFQLDTSLTFSERYRHQSIALIREQADTSTAVGEHTINPNGLWRRSIETWHRGAGQIYFDRADSDPARFRTSKGVDCWTRGSLTLLPQTALIIGGPFVSAGAEHIAATSTRLFYTGGSATYYIDTLNTVSTAMTGTHTFTSITTDGYFVYATDGSDVYQWTRAATSTGAAWNTLDCTLLRWVHGRLMAANGANAYNITSSAAPTAMTVAAGTVTSDWLWVDFAGGASCIYGAGYQGSKSLVFRSAIKSDATGLDVWVQAAELPDGEVVRSLFTYLGFTLIGSDSGVRVATADSNGDLTLGALIETPGAVRCFEGQGRFVWFGVDGVGLYRLDLTQIVDSAPAYAPDLAAAASGIAQTGNVYSVATYAGVRVFSVVYGGAGGPFYETTSPVPYGTIDSGIIAFGLPEDKTAISADVRFEPLETITASEGLSVAVAVNGASTFTPLGSSTVESATGAEWDAGQSRAESHELRLTILSDTSSGVLFPSLT